MFAGLQVLHPFIQDPKHKNKQTNKNHHRHLHEKHMHTYSRSCPSFCLREMKVCVKWAFPRSCSVAIIPQQTMRGCQSTSKEKEEKQALHSNIGSYIEGTEGTILNERNKRVCTPGAIHPWMNVINPPFTTKNKTRHSARCQ